MENKVDIEVNRIRFLLRHLSLKELSEQIEPVPWDRIPGTEEDEINKSEVESIKNSETQNEYPNYCKYPDKAIYPKIKSISDEDSLIKGFCNYSAASVKGGLVALYVPQNATVLWWDNKSLSDFSKTIQKEYKNYSSDINLLYSHLSKILPLGTIRRIITSKDVYNTYLKWDESINNWQFGGFYSDKTRTFYTQPQWIDKRSEYQKFIDEYGLIVQLTAVAATIAAGLLSGGAAWVIGLEVFLELAVGVPVSIRELEKGENISAAFSFLTAIIPIFKLSRSLRGITDAEFDSLSNSIIRSNLTRNSSGQEFETWMKGLNETDQKTLRKILEYDDKTKKEIVDQVTLFAQEQGQIFKELSKSLKANKNILKDVGFFQKLWAKELTANGVVAIIALSLKMCCEEELDSSEKEKLKGFYNRIPDSLKKEVAYNLFQNSPEIKKILPLLNNVTTLMDSAKIVDNSKKCEWLNTELKKEFTKEGLDYIELGDDSTRAKPQENISSEMINNLRNNGWVPKNELGDKEFFDVKFIGDGWYLVK